MTSPFCLSTKISISSQSKKRRFLFPDRNFIHVTRVDQAGMRRPKCAPKSSLWGPSAKRQTDQKRDGAKRSFNCREIRPSCKTRIWYVVLGYHQVTKHVDNCGMWVCGLHSANIARALPFFPFLSSHFKVKLAKMLFKVILNCQIVNFADLLILEEPVKPTENGIRDHHPPLRSVLWSASFLFAFSLATWKVKPVEQTIKKLGKKLNGRIPKPQSISMPHYFFATCSCSITLGKRELFSPSS